MKNSDTKDFFVLGSVATEPITCTDFLTMKSLDTTCLKKLEIAIQFAGLALMMMQCMICLHYTQGSLTCQCQHQIPVNM